MKMKMTYMVKIQCAEIMATPQMQKDVSKPLYSTP